MKKILLWEPPEFDGLPRTIAVGDATASAAIRAGVAVAADATQTGLLGQGASLPSATPTLTLLYDQISGERLRIELPLAVALIAAAEMSAAIIGRPPRLSPVVDTISINTLTSGGLIIVSGATILVGA